MFREADTPDSMGLFVLILASRDSDKAPARVYQTVLMTSVSLAMIANHIAILVTEQSGQKWQLVHLMVIVHLPSCDSSGSVNRVVGYYEGWVSRRTCNAFYPEDVPSGVYSHINFAFATIDPVTFEVRPASTADVKLYTRLTSLKDLDPDLKVYIAIGGWTFNDPGPTASTFSDIAGSEANQKAFIKSLIAFMSTYNFDGVDIDWEYPGADDRRGRPTDFANFPKFMANLKSSLEATGGRDGLTITIPASY
ncbi:hypothetical protein IFR05_009385 [Cadophora sp. M221]|nr:hypothetical protein IFR05_009385 [Cadophora sp. M221]